MSHPQAFTTHLELAAFQAVFDTEIHIFYAPHGNPPPLHPQANTCYVYYSNEHFQTISYHST